VEFKNGLSDQGWQSFNVPVSITNDIGQATDPAPALDHRFYRIVAF
jgi:hypothetical protein